MTGPERVSSVSTDGRSAGPDDEAYALTMAVASAEHEVADPAQRAGDPW
jgi:hypothetical protein